MANDYEIMPGKDCFDTTQLSLLLAAREGPTVVRQEAMTKILECYWRPVYHYLCRKGNSDHLARDLTQSFFTRILEQGKSSLIHKVDASKGRRFRSFLLTALDNFVKDEFRKRNAAKRKPAQGWVHLDASESPRFELQCPVGTPEEEFHRTWAVQLLEDVVQQVEMECLRDGKSAHWEVFNQRVLLPITTGDSPTSPADLCKQYSLKNEQAVSNMVVTVKRRFVTEIRDRVRQWVTDDGGIEHEISELIRFLG